MKQQVPDVVPEGIVDLLEVVQVQIEKPDPGILLGLRCNLGRGGKTLVELDAIGQPSEDIMVGQELDPLLGGEFVGDVASDLHYPLDLPVGPPVGAGADLHVALSAIEAVPVQAADSPAGGERLLQGAGLPAEAA